MNRTLKIGMNRGSARIWIEGAALAAEGWHQGTPYDCEFGDGRITYTRREGGGRKVAGTDKRPIIDTNTDKIRSSLGACTHVAIEISAAVITMTPGKAPSIGSAIVGAVTAIAIAASAIAAPYISQFKRGAMSVLVACEESATVRDAFTRMGHDAVSCDLMDTRNPYGWHVKGDVTPYLSRPWDLVIGFPPCTFNVVSAAWAFKDPDFEKYPGVGYHQRVKPGTLTGEARRIARLESIEFIKAIYASADKVAIENPKGFLGKLWLEPTQEIEPNQFGHPHSKTTCLWLKNLPPLEPTDVLDITKHGWQTADGTWRWMNQTASGQNNLPPSDDRAKIRSTTYPGIARAMAEQWGRFPAAASAAVTRKPPPVDQLILALA
jgi:hypothetical protein